jgi:dihydropteroate synthase
MRIGTRTFGRQGTPHILGVVNLSPESPNQDSVARDVDEVVARARLLTTQGAAMIDLGAQSSNFTAPVLPEDVEVERLTPGIRALKAAGMLVSVDTWRPAVARAAVAAGADVLDDSDGFQDPALIEVLAAARLPIILPFIAGTSPHDPGVFDFDDPLRSMLPFFEAALARAAAAGLTEIILDPGTGYATPHLSTAAKEAMQRRVYPRLWRFREFGYPLLVALPRKADPTVTRELAQMIVDNGVDWVRAHDVALAAAARAARRLAPAVAESEAAR